MPGAQGDLWDRILAKIELPESYEGCWIWKGAKSHKRRSKRPVIQIGGRGTPVRSVARLVCERAQGPPPTPEHEAGHICPEYERADCVAPHHLVWQTRVENELYKHSRRSS